MCENLSLKDVFTLRRVCREMRDDSVAPTVVTFCAKAARSDSCSWLWHHVVEKLRSERATRAIKLSVRPSSVALLLLAWKWIDGEVGEKACAGK